jgi:hypothetical protein
VLGLGICFCSNNSDLYQSEAMIIGIFVSSIGLYSLSKTIPSNSSKTKSYIVTEYDEEE